MHGGVPVNLLWNSGSLRLHAQCIVMFKVSTSGTCCDEVGLHQGLVLTSLLIIYYHSAGTIAHRS